MWSCSLRLHPCRTSHCWEGPRACLAACLICSLPLGSSKFLALCPKPLWPVQQLSCVPLRDLRPALLLKVLLPLQRQLRSRRET